LDDKTKRVGWITLIITEWPPKNSPFQAPPTGYFGAWFCSGCSFVLVLLLSEAVLVLDRYSVGLYYFALLVARNRLGIPDRKNGDRDH
jgi:hypothetical protein